MDRFIQFMESRSGRLLRVAVGVVLIGVGLFAVEGIWTALIVALGFIPLIAGLVGVCLIGPLVGYTLDGQPRHARLG